jgi:hypothetical protein
VRWKRLISFVALISAGVATFWVGVARDNSAPAALAATLASAPAVPVTEGQAETRDVPIWLSGIGSVQPLNAVTVKVRVDGQLDRVAFTEGQDVRKGDILAQIDPRSFRAQLKQAQANKAKDEAQLANARLDLERSMRLEAKGVATKQTLDTQRAQVAALEATLEADQAAIDMAQLQVEFSRTPPPLLPPVAPEGLMEALPASLITQTEGEWGGGERAPALVFVGWDRLCRDSEQDYKARQGWGENAHSVLLAPPRRTCAQLIETT